MIKLFGAGLFVAGLLLIWSTVDELWRAPPFGTSHRGRHFVAGLLIGVGIVLFFFDTNYQW